MNINHAIILAAGLGLRMRPLTETLPKPLIQVNGRALIDYAMDFVQTAGISNIVVNASYRARQIAEHMQAYPGVTISYEDTPLETGGGIREALPKLGSAPFLSANADVICLNGESHAAERLAEAWFDASMDALLLLHPRERAVGYDGPGDFFLHGDRLERRGERAEAPFVFTGVQLIHPRLFAGCPPQGPFSINELYNRDLSRIRAIVHEGDWLHVGDLAGKEAAERYFNPA